MPRHVLLFVTCTLFAIFSLQTLQTPSSKTSQFPEVARGQLQAWRSPLSSSTYVHSSPAQAPTANPRSLSTTLAYRRHDFAPPIVISTRQRFNPSTSFFQCDSILISPQLAEEIRHCAYQSTCSEEERKEPCRIRYVRIPRPPLFRGCAELYRIDAAPPIMTAIYSVRNNH